MYFVNPTVVDRLPSMLIAEVCVMVPTTFSCPFTIWYTFAVAVCVLLPKISSESVVPALRAPIR